MKYVGKKLKKTLQTRFYRKVNQTFIDVYYNYAAKASLSSNFFTIHRRRLAASRGFSVVLIQKSSSAVTELVSGPNPGTGSSATGGSSTATPTDGAVFVVHRQPFALDRFTVTDVKPRDATGA